jgi:signal peptidase I
MSEGRFITFSSLLFELTKVAIVIVVILAIFGTLVGLPLLVSGQSMEPNFHDRQVVIVEQLSYFGGRAISRGDVVAAKFPADPQHTKLIKRVIGLPGDRVEVTDTQIRVNGQPLTENYQPRLGQPPYDLAYADTQLASDQYFLMGDNRPGSSDSRLWGPVTRTDIVGRVSFVLWPISAIRFIDHPDYGS